MNHLDVNALQGKSEDMRGSEWIKIGVTITYGTTIPGDNALAFRTTIGQFVKSGKRVHVAGCDDW